MDGMGGNTNNCGAPEIVTGSRDGNPMDIINVVMLFTQSHKTY